MPPLFSSPYINSYTHVELSRSYTRESDSESASASPPMKGPNSVPRSSEGIGNKGGSDRVTGGMKQGKKEESSSEEEEDDETAHSTSSAGNTSTGTSPGKVPPGGYDPSDYSHLSVSSEIKELFQYIGRYKPHQIELETRLKCFIPDYIPSVGENDAFIKIPRPDGKPDDLGLIVVDEPSAEQSDPTVLELQMRAITKKHNLEPMVVRSIENAAHNSKDVQRWIDSIEDLHRSKPPPQVHYTKNMPDIESLMQIWPEEVEKVLEEMELPSAEMECTINEFSR